MIAKTSLDFLKALAKNNNKPWFDDNRAKYEAARENVKTAVTQLIPKMEQIDDAIAEAKIEPKNCMFRINRDIRFSKEKHPYKNNMGIQFNAYGKGLMRAGYYIHIEPGKCFLGGGIWMPMAPELKKIRQEIDYNLKAFKSIVESKKFVSCYSNNLLEQESLVRPPKGYDENNPALQYIKLKNFVAIKPVSDAEMIDAAMLKNVISSFTTLQPFIKFLNNALD